MNAKGKKVYYGLIEARREKEKEISFQETTRENTHTHARALRQLFLIPSKQMSEHHHWISIPISTCKSMMTSAKENIALTAFSLKSLLVDSFAQILTERTMTFLFLFFFRICLVRCANISSTCCLYPAASTTSNWHWESRTRFSLRTTTTTMMIEFNMQIELLISNKIETRKFLSVRRKRERQSFFFF